MHIFLVGPPGIGKSTLAPLLAERLGGSVIELDLEIERATKRPNRDVIDGDGMERFRELETAALRRLRPTPAIVVVDTGGGTPVAEENRAWMRTLGLIVGLRGTEARVARGIAATLAKRPGSWAAPRRASAVLRERRAAYADVDVDFDVRSDRPARLADRLAAWLLRERGMRIAVHGSSPYPIVARAGLLREVGGELAALGWGGRVAVVCDRTSARLHAPAVARSLRRAGLEPRVIGVPIGERAKSPRALQALWSALAEAGIARDGGVVAIGGGATGDLAGFAAATYMRGIRVAHVPTTLLAMVDSSIGGKTAVDLAEGKNLVGAFHQPDAVLADVSLVATLPRRQRASGLGEVAKCAFLTDRTSVAQVRRTAASVLDGAPGPSLAALVLGASVKADIVSVDEREEGVRVLLNYGHTMGHAYEASSGYRVTHGEAVAVGMTFATALAVALGLAPASLQRDVEATLEACELPTRAKIPARAWSLLSRDKKARAGRVRWILPRQVGRFSEVTDVPERALRAAAAVVEAGA